MIDEKAILRASCDTFTQMRDLYAAALDGLPDDVVRTWKPSAERQGGGAMNTFGTLGAHLARSSRWVGLHYIYGVEVTRDRDAEFTAEITRDEALAEMDAFLADFRAAIDERPCPALTEKPDVPVHARPEFDRLHWLQFMNAHWGLHVGDVQIQRQLWEAEHDREQ